mmetsp:Transcript_4485/g.10897  ORF Transcript_4485/g.10897 Transcript_4485/m.10897 type:complete len:278 (-) Transcript_4485:3077-3910(-)
MPASSTPARKRIANPTANGDRGLQNAGKQRITFNNSCKRNNNSSSSSTIRNNSWNALDTAKCWRPCSNPFTKNKPTTKKETKHQTTPNPPEPRQDSTTTHDHRSCCHFCPWRWRHRAVSTLMQMPMQTLTPEPNHNSARHLGQEQPQLQLQLQPIRASRDPRAAAIPTTALPRKPSRNPARAALALPPRGNNARWQPERTAHDISIQYYRMQCNAMRSRTAYFVRSPQTPTPRQSETNATGRRNGIMDTTMLCCTLQRRTPRRIQITVGSANKQLTG